MSLLGSLWLRQGFHSRVVNQGVTRDEQVPQEEVLEFLARVVDPIPEPSQQTVRYWGFYANGAGSRRRKAAAVGDTPSAPGWGLNPNEYPPSRNLRPLHNPRLRSARKASSYSAEIPDAAYDGEYEVLLFEFKADLNAYLAAGGVDPSVDTLAELIEFNRQHADQVMPWFGQEIFEQSQAKGPLNDPAYLKALDQSYLQVSKLIEKVMQENDLDAIIAPTNSPAWTTDLVNGDHWGGDTVSSSSPAAISGYPAITLPMGAIHGLPIGLSFLGLPFTESELLGFAYALEQRLGAWQAPSYRPDIEAPAN